MKIKDCILTPKWGDIPICKYKSFEYQFEGSSFMNEDLFEFKVQWTRNCDHAGISFTFGIWKLFWMNLNIHDHRHWDYENNTWDKYQESANLNHLESFQDSYTGETLYKSRK